MKYFALFILSLIVTQLLAQQDKDHWEPYMAQYEKGAGSVLVNMSLKKLAPVKEYVFLLKAGVKINHCTEDGLPSKDEWDNLYNISDKVKAVVNAHGTFKSSGVFTYQCWRTDYYYIKDTIGIRETLLATFKKNTLTNEYKVEIKSDPKWDAYLTFLYPNEETMEFIDNQKVVMRLVQAGDKLTKPRQVDHWLYFNTEATRNQFVNYALQQSYKIEGKDFSQKSDLHFQLHLSKTEDVNLANISTITLKLRRKAKELGGDYDGWETFVIKD